MPLTTPDLLPRIRAGHITQLRLDATDPQPEIGNTYALQTLRETSDDGGNTRRSRSSEGHITVTAVERRHILDIDQADAKREGHKTPEKAREYWEAQLGDVEHVWVVRFQNADEIRLLPQHSELGYTTSRYQALSDEPEAVGDAALAEYAATARARDRRIQQRRERDLNDQPLPDRLRNALHTARTKGTDIRDEVRNIERQIVNLERRTNIRAA